MAEPQELINAARTAAFNRVQAALMQVRGNLVPNLPPLIVDLLKKEELNPANRVIDPFVAGQARARLLASQFFDWDNPNMEQIAEILSSMRNWLGNPSLPVVQSDASDSRCGVRAGYCGIGQPPIHLCPPFFSETGEEGIAPPAEQRIRTMVHETAHLVGIGNADQESYYQVFDGDPGLIAGFDMADAWSHYVHVVGFQPLDPPAATISGRPGAGGTTPPGGGPPTVGPRMHTVVFGDYLTKLAKTYYGDGQLWRKIYDANRAVIGPDPNKIYPGQKLVIP